MHPDCKPDDLSIKNAEFLLRRIPPKNINSISGKIMPDAFLGLKCSVELQSKSSPRECLAHQFVEGFDAKNINKKSKKLLKQGWMVAGLLVELPRKYDQTVFPESEVEVGGQKKINEAHCIICGEKDDEILYKLAQKAEIVLPE